MKKDLIIIFKERGKNMIFPIVILVAVLFIIRINSTGTAEKYDFPIIGCIIVGAATMIFELIQNFLDRHEKKYAFKSYLVFSLIWLVILVILVTLIFVSVKFFL